MNDEYDDGCWFFIGFPVFVLGLLLLMKEAAVFCSGPALLLMFAMRIRKGVK